LDKPKLLTPKLRLNSHGFESSIILDEIPHGVLNDLHNLSYALDLLEHLLHNLDSPQVIEAFREHDAAIILGMRK